MRKYFKYEFHAITIITLNYEDFSDGDVISGLYLIFMFTFECRVYRVLKLEQNSAITGSLWSEPAWGKSVLCGFATFR